MKKNKIDFVIAWVDGSDPKWIEEKNKYSSKKIETSNAINRYRDMDLLKYWFRGVEEFAPWVNKIHFVTWGHFPEWLDINNEKINIVNHKDFIPSKYLPVFSSHPIELNLHRIEGLSDKFVYFNDDMFLLKRINEDFYFKNNLPCDMWRDNIQYCDKFSDAMFERILLNDKMLISKNFYKRDVMNKNLSKCFNLKYGKTNIRFLMLYKWPYMAGFDNYHFAAPFLKNTFYEVWNKEFDTLDSTSKSKFRSDSDVNQYVMQLWQVYSGSFTPVSYKGRGKFFNLSNNNELLYKYIDEQLVPQICINDSDLSTDYDLIKKELKEHFEKILPEKSSFEK